MSERLPTEDEFNKAIDDAYAAPASNDGKADVHFIGCTKEEFYREMNGDDQHSAKR